MLSNYSTFPVQEKGPGYILHQLRRVKMAWKVYYSPHILKFAFYHCFEGIISAIAFSPSYNAEESFYAAGSFSPTFSNIAMFSEQQEQPLMFVEGGPRAGVTQANPILLQRLYNVN